MLLAGMSPLYPRLPPLYGQEVSGQEVCIYEVNQQIGSLKEGGK